MRPPPILGYTVWQRGSGGIGRRASLRSWWPKGRRGSSPFFRTTFFPSDRQQFVFFFIDVQLIRACVARTGNDLGDRVGCGQKGGPKDGIAVARFELHEVMNEGVYGPCRGE